jgi:hypothetical protein
MYDQSQDDILRQERRNGGADRDMHLACTMHRPCRVSVAPRGLLQLMLAILDWPTIHFGTVGLCTATIPLWSSGHPGKNPLLLDVDLNSICTCGTSFPPASCYPFSAHGRWRRLPLVVSTDAPNRKGRAILLSTLESWKGAYRDGAREDLALSVLHSHGYLPGCSGGVERHGCDRKRAAYLVRHRLDERGNR